jgi:hypothetical protein
LEDLWFEVSQGRERDLISTNRYVWVTFACHPRDGGKFKIGGLQSRPAWAKSETLSPK